jgi:hypothetical protein
VDRNRERRHPGAVAAANDQVINVEGRGRSVYSLMSKYGSAIKFAKVVGSLKKDRCMARNASSRVTLSA